MKHPSFVFSIFLIGTFTLPYGASAQEYTHTKDPIALECIRSLKLTPKNIESGLYDYHIDRCASAQKRRNDASGRLKRIALRARTIQSRLIRNSRGTLYNALPQVGHVNSAVVFFRPSLRSIKARLTQTTQRQQRKEASLTRRMRSAKARTACIAVENSFRENCVRDFMRRLGSE